MSDRNTQHTFSNRVFTRAEYTRLTEEITRRQNEARQQQQDLANQLNELKNARVRDDDAIIKEGVLDGAREYANFLRERKQAKQRENEANAPIALSRPTFSDSFEPSTHSWLYDRYNEKERKLTELQTSLSRMQVKQNEFIEYTRNYWAASNNERVVTKTIGPGGDFANFGQVFTWARGRHTMYGKILQIRIIDGFRENNRITFAPSTLGSFNNIEITGGGNNTYIAGFYVYELTVRFQNLTFNVDRSICDQFHATESAKVVINTVRLIWKITKPNYTCFCAVGAASMYIGNPTISGNVSGGNCFFAASAASMCIWNSTISGNVSGGNCFYADSAASMYIGNPTISGNVSGGNCFYADSAASMCIGNSTMRGEISGTANILRADWFDGRCITNGINIQSTVNNNWNGSFIFAKFGGRVFFYVNPSSNQTSKNKLFTRVQRSNGLTKPLNKQNAGKGGEHWGCWVAGY